MWTTSISTEKGKQDEDFTHEGLTAMRIFFFCHKQLENRTKYMKQHFSITAQEAV